MTHELWFLVWSAIVIAVAHTATGPDHYLPFIVISRVKKWSLTKTIVWTIICGLGHVSSSVLLGLLGAALGWSLSGVMHIENIRGGLAGWIFLTIGALYFVWGLWKATNDQPHKHFDIYDDSVYVYEHDHNGNSPIVMPSDRKKVTPWVLFIIFILGPCEPLIPMLFFPATKHSAYGIYVLVSVFMLFTLITMLTMVLLGYYGIKWLKTDKLEKYMHALAGGTILLCGIGMVFLNW